MTNLLDANTQAANDEIRTLDAAEVDQVAGGRVRAIIVLGDCTTPPVHSIDGVPVIIYNPWIQPGSPERSGTGTSF